MPSLTVNGTTVITASNGKQDTLSSSGIVQVNRITTDEYIHIGTNNSYNLFSGALCVS